MTAVEEADKAPEEAETPARKPKIDLPVFGVAAAIVIALVVWGLAAPENLNNVTTSILNWITGNLGWLFILAATGFLLFALYLAFSKYGRVPLGKDGETPEYKTVSWIAMMFSAGMGIGLMFYGAYEPIAYFADEASIPPGYEAGDVATAMATTMFHWGFHPWAIYAVVGLAIAYSTYRCGRKQLISAVFAPFLGRGRGASPVAKIIDILAIFATLFGTTASLGLGAVQIAGGFDRLGWMTATDQPSTLLLVGIIAVLTACFVASAVSGIAKGIQWLSNTNMVLALILAVFVFVVGPTVFILDLIPTSLGSYLNDLTSFSARSGATVDASGEEWMQTWTIFYWAWWISWTPFVGLFLAKISKGRSIREFVIGVMLVPTGVSLVWFAIFGGTAVHQAIEGKDLLSGNTADTLLFDVLDNLPLGSVSAVLVMILVSIFFVSGADSASLVMATLSENGEPEPSRKTTIFWGVLTGLVAIVLLSASGEDSLEGIKTMAIIAALPFVLVMIGMCAALYKDLRRDPLIVVSRTRSGVISSRVRVLANSLAAHDDSNDVLPSDRLPTDPKSAESTITVQELLDEPPIEDSDVPKGLL